MLMPLDNGSQGALFGGNDAGAHARAFILAGDAVVTFVSLRTGNRFTYRVQASDDGQRWYVTLLTGPNNEEDYTFLGTIFADNGNYAHGRKSMIARGAPGDVAFAYCWGFLRDGKAPKDAEVYHEGKCGKCGRRLTTPESITLGLGPVCAKGRQ
jgi:hypothetical protein